MSLMWRPTQTGRTSSTEFCQGATCRGDEKLIDVIKPSALELKEKVISSPLTIFYSNLETCGECYSYFEQELGEQQFYPPGSPANLSNRLFAQYHAQYPEEYHTSLVKSLISGTSVARVLFVTVAFGVGIDVPTVERVIQIGIPYTMEDFLQETGRAGRNGNSAISVLYYNSYDISKVSSPGYTCYLYFGKEINRVGNWTGA
ncbi:uncharacterized protein [Montipora foliosa]|uniref:uncharacterized protein n=1 Tax=Montipora foliosa TaxID=591990 RepID=UPI0035F1F57F